ncbi:MAG: EFR1 family ferrodoxin [Clostridiales bacterium]|nr:EFR1 family ferrodoxin [Clostridiales bacterium]
MSTEIYYFSGTGNSLFVAKELAKRLPGATLVPVASLIDIPENKTSGSTVGIVFPVHALTIPIVISRFIKKTDFSSADYIFAVATRLGTVFYGFEKINALLRKNEKTLASQLVLNMCDNEARHKGYIVPSDEDIKTTEKDVLLKIDSFAETVKDKKTSRPADTGVTQPSGKTRLTSFLIERTVLTCMNLAEHTGGAQYFCADDHCNGCGICENVCLSGKITMKDKRPVWQKNVFCTMCFACLNFCPKRAVQINDIPGVPSFTRENGRYPHPYAFAGDIIKQKGERAIEK